MAFDDTLFQLGMDLTRSSTAQEEDIGEVAFVDRESEPERVVASLPRKERVVARDNSKLSGTHLILDLFGASHLDDVKHIERTLKRWVELSGARLLHIHMHRFSDEEGVTGVVVFDQGHATIRTWPQRAFAAVDVMYMARNGEQRDSLIKAAERAFLPGALETTVCRRAGDGSRTGAAVPQVRDEAPRLTRAA